MEEKQKKTSENRVSDFIFKYRVFFLSIIGALIAVALVIAIVLSVNESANKKGLAAIDTLTLELTAAQKAESVDQVKIDSIIEEASKLATGKKGVISVRAYMLIADIEFQNGDWASSSDAWIKAAEADEKAYTSPLCYYNAGVCFEEMNDLPKAIENLNKAVSFDNFSLKSRALFNLGRLNEEANHFQEAADAYTKLNDEFPSDNWANLGKSRLIILKSEGKIQ